MKLNQYFLNINKKNIWYASNTNLNKKQNLDKPFLLFLNGLTCDELHFKKQLRYFHKKGYPFLITHYRNHFKSDNFSLNEVTLKSLAMDIKKIIKKHELKNIILIGHSLGANIALLVSLLSPRSIDKVIFIAGPASKLSDSMFQSNILDFILPLIKKASITHQLGKKLIWTSLNSHIIAIITKKLGFNPEKVSTEYVKTYIKGVASVDPNVFLTLFNEIIHTNFTSQMALIKKPVLIIGGEKDTLVPSQQYKTYSQVLSNCELFLVPRGSHVPQVEFPRDINKKINNFISDAP